MSRKLGEFFILVGGETIWCFGSGEELKERLEQLKKHGNELIDIQTQWFNKPIDVWSDSIDGICCIKEPEVKNV